MLLNKRFLYFFLLISVVIFLFLPKFSLANNIEDTNLKEIEKHLELNQKDVQSLIDTLKQIFTEETISLWSSTYATDEEIAVAVILLRVIRIEVLNHLLFDAPIEVIKNIINYTVKISRIFLIKDISGILEELERESVNSAIEYGVNALLQKEIKIAPGVIKFIYPSYEGYEKEVIFQYIMVYYPLDIKSGTVKIGFYSPSPIDAPDASKIRVGYSLSVPDLRRKLPPFIVEIEGTVEKTELGNYKWINMPSTKINFSGTIPDLGIKPLSFWEKNLLKPIKNKIKEVEIIITTITARSFNITENIYNIPNVIGSIWNKIKSAPSIINPFLPAALVENSQTSQRFSVADNLVEIKPKIEEDKFNINKLEVKSKVNLGEIQEILDDITEKIDVINQEVEELVINKSEKQKEQEQLEKELVIKKNENKEINFCEKIGIPGRNKIIFNEIAWMGTNNSSNNEWIELKNLSNETINLSKWQLWNKEKKIKIIFNDGEQIPANSFYILERMDDNSLKGVVADLVYSGILNNKDEALYLFDEKCQLQDEIFADPNWPAGDNYSKRTMERRFNLTWQTSTDLIGTPKIENSVEYYEYFGSGGEGDSEIILLSSSSSLQLLPKILISEIQIETSSSSGYDFIELYNPTANNIDISGFQLKKKSSTGKEYSVRVFPENSFISSQNYFLWANSNYASSVKISADITSSQNLSDNNSLTLLDKNKNIIDSLSWGTSTDFFVEGLPFLQNPTADQSLGRKWSTTSQGYIDTDNNQNDFEIQNPTPKAQNQTLTLSSILEPEELLLDVVINEISWMGTKISSNDEWIELYNNTSNEINLTNWTLSWSHGTTVHSFTFSTSTGKTIISSKGFYLLERTNDQNVFDIVADQIYTGVLINDGEKIELRNASNTLIDIVDCSSGWFAGNSSPNYISMERINFATSGIDYSNWANNNIIIRNSKDAAGNKINGTPRAQNSVSQTETQISSLPFDEFSEITLTYYGNPYIIKNTLIIPQGKTLIIEPGVILNVGNILEINGTLKSEGMDSKKIIISGCLPDNCYKGQLYFTSQSKNSVFKNVFIEKGHSDGVVRVSGTNVDFQNTEFRYSNIALLLENSSSTISYCTFLDNSAISIQINGGTPIIKNSLFNAGNLAIKIDNNSQAIIENNFFEHFNYPQGTIFINNSYPICKGNSGQNNNINGIYIWGTIVKDWLLYKNEIPYVIASLTVASSSTLEIKPGTVISFTTNPSGGMEINGTLKAVGREEDKIVFTSLSPPSRWATIHFNSSNTTSTLEYVIISYGFGVNPEQGVVYVDNSKVELRYVTFEENYYNLCFKNSPQSTLSSLEFKSCLYRGFRIEGECPVMENFPLDCTCNFASPLIPCATTSSSICL